jgi:S-DNA-T family DNA segregation ATPase FtsK/SpoIIIE
MTSNPKRSPVSEQKPPVEITTPYDKVVDNSKAVVRHLRKFGWDLIGTFLILVSLLTLLGLFGLTRGTIINSWILVLKRGFGWGSYLFVVILGLLGYAVFRFSGGKGFPLKFSRFLALEGAFFAFLPLLSLIRGVSLDRAIQGLDGGTLGWGLAELLIPVITAPLTAILFSLLLIIFLGIGSGLVNILIQKALAWSNSPGQVAARREYSTSGEARRNVQSRQKTESADKSVSTLMNQWRDDRLPPLNILLAENIAPPDQNRIKNNARLIETKLAEFGIPVKVIGFRVGPTVTQYALEPGYVEKQGPDGAIVKQKVKVAQISALSRDLTLALSATRLRIETPVPGRSYVGVEVPNEDNAFVRLRPILESDEYRKKRSPLTISLGRNVSGDEVAVDLEKLPHLLIAGTTNSGKSVCVTAITTCLVMNNTPNDLRLVMLDPKMVELVRFNGLPHLLGKVETELERMLAVLQWAQTEMDSRYRMLAEAKARNLESYNQKMLQKKKPTLPRIVILIDELADLMMSAPDQTEHSLIRLAQMARATGIHMVVATQRPSTDVVTGLIKANFPARISFAVASSVDSRVILDSSGAEDLLGRGDMLFLDPQRSGLQRLQGIIVSDMEIEKIQNHWQKMSHGETSEEAPWEKLVQESGPEDSDKLIAQAVEVVRGAGRASASLLQRRLRVGYPRAARLIDELEEMGVVGPSVGSGKDREVIPLANDGEEEEFQDE